MYATYRLNSNELDINFLETVKSRFKDKDIDLN